MAFALVGIGTLWFFLVGLPVLASLLWLCLQFARAERARFAITLGVRIPAPPLDLSTGAGWWRRIRRFLAAPAARRQFGYALIRFPLSLAEAAIVTAMWSFALAILGLPVLGWLMYGVDVLRNPAEITATAALGLILLLAAPHLTQGLAVADTAIARYLIGPGSGADMTVRIGELERSRARVVTAAQAERRRIERDLHDGAQQRLVALAMDLGRAKARFADDPEGAKAIIDQAHADAKGALTELRNLVRGVHPPVLTDRGLDAAISGLAALSPVPVTVHADLDTRPTASVEAIAYFVVAEALTNVAKHTRATRADGLARPPRGRAACHDPRRRRWWCRPARAGPVRPGGPGRRGGRAAVGTQPGRRPDRHRGRAAMRIVIAEDSVLLREGLTRLLAEAGHDVVAAAGEAEEFLRAVGRHEPDAVVVDVRMPPTFTDEGLRAALVVRSRWPAVGVLVLSQWVEERYATELLSDRPGGVGYLLKDRVADLAEFLDALSRVAAGGSALDPEVVAQLLARSRHPLAGLTAREREVLALMAEGRSNAAIAAALVVGEGAVAKHINSIFAKLRLAPADRDHRRVLAVLRYLGADRP